MGAQATAILFALLQTLASASILPLKRRRESRGAIILRMLDAGDELC